MQTWGLLVLFYKVETETCPDQNPWQVCSQQAKPTQFRDKNKKQKPPPQKRLNAAKRFTPDNESLVAACGTWKESGGFQELEGIAMATRQACIEENKNRKKIYSKAKDR